MANGNGQTMTPSAGAMVRQEIGATEMQVHAETAAVAVAAAQEAMVKARVGLAKHSPRDISRVRARILADCTRPGFADAAVYSKPVGKKKVTKKDAKGKEFEVWEEQYIEGLSVRFSEAMLRHMGNLFVDSMIVADDTEKRIIKVMCMDLETNATDSGDVVISKLVERKAVKDFKTNQWGPPAGRVVRGERFNSYGDRVYIVEATEDELLNKTNAVMSKMRRNKILELCPADIVEEAKEQCAKTSSTLSKEEFDTRRVKMLASFKALVITEGDLEKFLGHGLVTLSLDELNRLRQIHAAVEDGETTWATVMESRGGVSDPETVKAPAAPAAATTTAQPAASATVDASPAPAASGHAAATDKAPPDPNSPDGAAELIRQEMLQANNVAELAALAVKVKALPEDLQMELSVTYLARKKELQAKAAGK